MSKNLIEVMTGLALPAEVLDEGGTFEMKGSILYGHGIMSNISQRHVGRLLTRLGFAGASEQDFLAQAGRFGSITMLTSFPNAGGPMMECQLSSALTDFSEGLVYEHKVYMRALRGDYLEVALTVYPPTEEHGGLLPFGYRISELHGITAPEQATAEAAG